MAKPQKSNITPIGGYSPDSMGAATRDKLRQYVARIERLEAEKAELAADIRDVYMESKSFGFDNKVLRQVVKFRRQEPSERAERQMLLDLYLGAMGE